MAVKIKPLTKAEKKTLEELQQRHWDTTVEATNLAEATPLPVSAIQATLAERGELYGDFTNHAQIAQDLQDIMRSSETNYGFIAGGEYYHGWELLSPVQKQALTVIADKIARILSGDPSYAVNWHDIQGYAKLVEDRLL